MADTSRAACDDAYFALLWIGSAKGVWCQMREGIAVREGDSPWRMPRGSCGVSSAVPCRLRAVVKIKGIL